MMLILFLVLLIQIFPIHRVMHLLIININSVLILSNHQTATSLQLKLLVHIILILLKISVLIFWLVLNIRKIIAFLHKWQVRIFSWLVIFIVS